MEKKNRFSNLLEQLMTKADLKNYTLAQELQYDVSYISKWVSGRMLPAEKSSEKVLHVISKCVVEALNEEGRENLFYDYKVDNLEDLQEAIYDNLEAEYVYVKNLKKSTGTEIAPDILFYSELPLLQFITKMKHPVLRRVKALEIVAAMDLLSLEHEYRLMIAGIENEHLSVRREYPTVHFSVMVNLDIGERDCLYDSIFLMNMMTNSSNVDFRLYGGNQAYGKIIFTVKDGFAISGMLFDNNHCMGVISSEDINTSNALCEKLKSLCTGEQLLFRKVSMRTMLVKYDYIQNVLSTNLRWLIGHMTEYFLPEDLFEELLSQENKKEWRVDFQMIRKTHDLTKHILEDSKIRIMIYESALTNFAVSGELDFYNHKVILTTEQRMKYMHHLLELIDKNPKLEMKLIHGGFVSGFQFIQPPSLFMSDMVSYLRLGTDEYQGNIRILNGASITHLFNDFYEEIWTNQKEVVIEDKETIINNIHHFMRSILLISKTEEK